MLFSLKVALLLFVSCESGFYQMPESKHKPLAWDHLLLTREDFLNRYVKAGFTPVQAVLKLAQAKKEVTTDGKIWLRALSRKTKTKNTKNDMNT